MHASIPLPGQYGAGPDRGRNSARIDRPLPSGLGRGRIVKQALALTVEIPELIGLQPVGQHAQKQMPRQVSRRLPPERRVPAGSQRAEIKITQPRDLGIESALVRLGRTNLHSGHDDQAERRLGCPPAADGGASQSMR